MSPGQHIGNTANSIASESPKTFTKNGTQNTLFLSHLLKMLELAEKQKFFIFTEKQMH